MSNRKSKYTTRRYAGLCSVIVLIAGLFVAAGQAQAADQSLTLGQKLDKQGVSIHLWGGYYALANSYGLKTDASQQHLFFNLFVDLDLEKLVGIPGGQIHLAQSYAPTATNVNYGLKLGDVFGATAPFIPRKLRLTRLTYEQHLFDDTIELEVGRSNPATYFMQSPCSFRMTCWNPMLMFDARAYAMPFAYWSATGRYNLNDNTYIQAGTWWLNPMVPFGSGWGWGHEHSDGNLYLLQIGRTTHFGEVAYPGHYDLTYYYTSVPQPNPADPSEVKDYAHGLMFEFYQTIYRADGGRNLAATNPTRLTLEGGASASLTSAANGGIGAYAFIGINAAHMIPSRPRATFGVRLTWFHLNDAYQTFLQQAGMRSGSPYHQSQDSFVLELNGHFVLMPGVSLHPWIDYVFNPSRYQLPSATNHPQEGYLFGVGITFALGQLLGYR